MSIFHVKFKMGIDLSRDSVVVVAYTETSGEKLGTSQAQRGTSFTSSPCFRRSKKKKLEKKC